MLIKAKRNNATFEKQTSEQEFFTDADYLLDNGFMVYIDKMELWSYKNSRNEIIFIDKDNNIVNAKMTRYN
jgi:hypothetical protein